jgi:tetratricopeptide (TPR) repeat protein
LPDDVFRLQKARYLAFKQEGLPAAVDLLQPVIESPAPDADAYRAYHAIIDYLLRLEDFDRVKRLVQEFEYQALDDCWRERVLFFSSYCSDVAMGHWIIDRLLATRRQPGWSQGALLSKARLHLRGNEYGKAIPYLESLIQMPSFPDGTDGNWVGTGHLEMAKVAEQHLRDYARAEALYQAVLDASQEIPKLQGEAFCDYAGFLRRQNRWQDALGVCQRGLRELPPTDTPERGLLQVFHAECLYRLGKEAEGLELLKQITTETKFPRVRSEGERVLKSINQQ